jgi:hypothetical protein
MSVGVSETIEVYFTGTATDISAYVASYSIHRGRSRELDDIPPGTLSVELRNYDGAFVPDDFASGGTYASNVNPGKRVVVTVESTVVFDGYIEDWTFDYDADLTVGASFTAVDGLGWLGLKRFDTDRTTSDGSFVGKFIQTVLAYSEINWAGSSSLEFGTTLLASTTISAGDDVLPLCQRVAQTDRGWFYASRSNVMTYRSRRNIADTSSALTLADDGTGIPFSTTRLAFGGDLLYTGAVITREGGEPRTSSDATAESTYGTRYYSLSGLLLRDDSASQDLADWIVVQYKDPQPRVSDVRVILDDLSTANVDSMCELDMGSKVDFVFTPRGSAEINTSFAVEGVRHESSVGGLHILTLSLSPIFVPDPGWFTLDDATLGKLDNGGVLAP